MGIMETKKLCEAVKPDGSQCRAAALSGTAFCFFHDPLRADERREAQALGGRQNSAKTLHATAPDVKIDNCRDIIALLSDTINQVRKGAIDARVANSVGYLANIAFRAFEQREIEERLETVEALLKGRSQVVDFTMTGT